MTTKICNKCKEVKSIDEFYKHPTCKSGRIPSCKKCLKLYYKDNKRQYKQRANNFHQSFAKYKTYHHQLEPYGIECRISPDDKNILEVKCWYDDCNVWHKPTNRQIARKLASLRGDRGGESNLYCSTKCKDNCSTYNRVKYRKGEEPNTHRTHQAELRSILIEERGTTCEKCGVDVSEDIICHHILPVKTDPLESLDKDNCILICSYCDKWIHQKDGCKTGQPAYC